MTIKAANDTAPVAAPAIKARLFEPSFTTKPVGAGIGLGLSHVYGFVKSAEGAVEINTAPGRGTTVRLYVPRSREQLAPAARQDDALLQPARAGEAVLVVEDSENVMLATEESLRQLGYGVLQAGDAAAALAVLGSGVRVDILFSDIVMRGGMNGVQFAVEARRLRPALRVLLTSGHAGTTLRQQGVPDDLPLLGKPYRRNKLARTLRVILG